MTDSPSEHSEKRARTFPLRATTDSIAPDPHPKPSEQKVAPPGLPESQSPLQKDRINAGPVMGLRMATTL